MKTSLLSERAQNALPSPTLGITARIKALQAQGVNVIGFGAGEPDFDTPEHVKAAAIRSLQSGFTKYTPSSGIEALKDAIIAKLERDQGLRYRRSQIIVSCGAKHSIYNLLQAVLNPGDEVIIPRPYWVSYPEQVKLAGGVPIFADAPEENGFQVTAAAIEAAITPRTRLVILNSPSNPTGAMISAEELARIATLVARRNLLVLSDEIYEHLTYGVAHVSIASFGEEIKQRTLVVNGFSKAYSMTGWRLGYLAGDEKIVAAMGRIQDQSTSNPVSFAQVGAVEALNGDQTCVEEMRAAFQERRDVIMARLNAMPGISCLRPDGAFYVFPNVSGLLSSRIPDGDVLAECLLTEAYIGVVPGSGFGAPRHIRLSYATSIKAIQEGMDRLQKAAERLVNER
ncbi:MAG: pyridoxal phosphate-dependent aminotransferase [Armatimonadetes bacterium]|nr:pyridoxal phosphate-dependent aminotransferase [Armatimonadota bacterium]